MMVYKNLAESMTEGKAVVRTDPKIGINKLVIEAPQTYFSYVEIANALNKRLKIGERPIDPNKIKNGLGIERMRMPTYSQSNATMAANALYSFIKNVDSDDYDREKFFSDKLTNIFYATESNPDFSRPEAEIALGMVYSKLLDENESRYRPYVEMLKNASVSQNTFACAGAGLALSSAVSNIYMNNSQGSRRSAIVLSTDTAVYESKRAPNAETTQGSAATLMWITADPELVAVDYKAGYGSFNLPVPDFTKFGFDTPIVHGKFSEKVYVYAVAMALENLESKHGLNANPLGQYRSSMNFFISHVPFPKQAKYFASFLYEHYLKNYEHDKFMEMQSRESLGYSPIDDKSLTAIFTEKFRNFRGEHDDDIVNYIESDAGINAYWSWLSKLRSQPEFESFLDRLRINDALKLPSQIGNSYTGSTIAAVASLLKSGNVDYGDNGACVFFGSGMVAVAYQLEITATQKSIGKNLIIGIENKMDIPLSHEDYEELHKKLVMGDAKRAMVHNKEGLIEKDKKLLRGSLPEGFLIKRRNTDGTWEAEFVENGERQVLKPRF